MLRHLPRFLADEQIPSQRRLYGLIAWCILTTLGLMIATWSLWGNTTAYPQVPWFAWGRSVSPQIDRAVFYVFIVIAILTLGQSVKAALWPPRDWFESECRARETCSRPQESGDWYNRLGLGLCFVCLTFLILLNQHRLQPWAYQFLLISLPILLLDRDAQSRDRVWRCLRLLMISLYLHSALSKFDSAFCLGLGRSFWDTLWRWMPDQMSGGLGADWQPRRPHFGPLLFPLVEFLIALGLTWSRTRSFAVWGAVGMHLILIAILSPWGLGHRPAVLIWNLSFVVLIPMVFLSLKSTHPLIEKDSSQDPRSATVPPAHPGLIQLSYKFRQMLTVTVVWTSVLIPFLEPFGLCDVWLAWGLYADHGERMAIFVSDSGHGKLPSVWKEGAQISKWDNLDPESEYPSHWRVRIDRISLQVTGAPIYPQIRFQIGVAIGLARQARLHGSNMSVVIESRATRWTGKRKVIRLNSVDEIELFADRLWFNAQPRS